MKYLILTVLITFSFSAFSLEVKYTEKEIELLDNGKSILKVTIDPSVHKQYKPSLGAENIKYLDPIVHIYGECAVINYGNAMYDTDGSESEINLPGNTYLYEMKTAKLKGVIEDFSASEFTILNKTSDNFTPIKEALLISINEGFIEKTYLAGADCSVKAKLNVPEWELSDVAEHNGTAYVVLGGGNRVIAEIRGEKVIIFREEKSN